MGSKWLTCWHRASTGVLIATISNVRSPGRKRPQKRKVAEGISSDVLAACAAQARYVGSPEHKTSPSFAGRMQARSDPTKCPTHLKDPDVITEWLAVAIRQGNVSAAFDGDFPRYVWALPRARACGTKHV